jgi:2-C-methyl-D-erythritol 4-phosphate cytidylyltransferase
VRDTVKESADGRRVVRTLDRARLWAAQTPQAFELARFRELCARAAAEGLVPTDDAALWERYVGPVPIVEGEPSNFKITTLEDLELARALFARRTAETPA